MIEELFDDALSGIKEGNPMQGMSGESSQHFVLDVNLKAAVRNGKREFTCEIINQRARLPERTLEWENEENTSSQCSKDLNAEGEEGASCLAWD